MNAGVVSKHTRVRKTISSLEENAGRPLCTTVAIPVTNSINFNGNQPPVEVLIFLIFKVRVKRYACETVRFSLEAFFLLHRSRSSFEKIAYPRTCCSTAA